MLINVDDCWCVCPCLPWKAGFARSCGQLESAYGFAAAFGVAWLKAERFERRKKDTVSRQEIVELWKVKWGALTLFFCCRSLRNQPLTHFSPAAENGFFADQSNLFGKHCKKVACRWLADSKEIACRWLRCSRDSLHWSPELKLEVKQTLHRCTCLRNEMHHFAPRTKQC